MSKEIKSNEKETQKSLIKMYATYVSKPKADFFQTLGLGVVQGERKGIYLITMEGSRKNQPPMELIDCRTSGGVFNLGHRHPAMIQALKDALDAGLDIGDHHMISAQRALLAKELAAILPPGISKTMYCAGGGEAVDLAIKLARGITKRKKVISAITGYHGVTGLALAAGDPKFKEIFQWNLPDFVQVPFGNLEEMQKVIDDQTACVILETIPATGGILIAPKGYFAGIRELCTQKGAMMIADEVQTGLCRTGEMWGIYGGLYPDEKIVPDFIVLAKGMSCGLYPLATCSYKPFIEKVFDQDPFLHISTTGGAEIGCFVTRKMLEIITQPEFLAHVRKVGAEFEAGLNQFQTKYSDLITNVRGRGLMWGIEFVNDRYGEGFTLRMIENGIFADYCGNNKKVVKLMPPLITSSEEIQEILKRLHKALSLLPKPK